MWRDWLMQSAPWLLLGVALGVSFGGWLRSRRGDSRAVEAAPSVDVGGRFLVLEKIMLETDADGRMSRVELGVRGVTAEYVEEWLTERGLVMTPKSVDFSAGKKPHDLRRAD